MKRDSINIETTYFGRYYKAYKINGKVLLSYDDKKSIVNRIAIFNKYVGRLNCKYYYDYLYGDNEVFTLEKFLGLPKELNVNFSKNVMSQIKFSKKLIKLTNAREPFYANVKNIFGKIRKEDIFLALRHQNACIEKGFLYLPNVKNAYIVLDKMSEEDLKKIIPSFSQYKFADQIPVSYNVEKHGADFIPNIYKNKQIEEFNKFFKLPPKVIAEIYFEADKKDVNLDKVYKKYKLDRRYIYLSSEIIYDPSNKEGMRARKNIFNIGELNIYKNLYYNLSLPMKSFLSNEDKEREKIKKQNKTKKRKANANLRYFVYCIKRVLFINKRPAVILSKKNLKTLFEFFDDTENHLCDSDDFFDWLYDGIEMYLDEYGEEENVDILEDIYYETEIKCAKRKKSSKNIRTEIQKIRIIKPITVRDEYKERLKKVLTQKEFNNLISKSNDREDFFIELHCLSVDYLEPETFNATEKSWELEALFNLISDDN